VVRRTTFGLFSGTLRNINYRASRRESAWYAGIRSGAMIYLFMNMTAVAVERRGMFSSSLPPTDERRGALSV
jgi:hypothetical protein